MGKARKRSLEIRSLPLRDRKSGASLFCGAWAPACAGEAWSFGLHPRHRRRRIVASPMLSFPPMEEHALSYEERVRLATEQARIAGFVLRRQAQDVAQALINEVESAEVAAMQARVQAAAKL